MKIRSAKNVLKLLIPFIIIPTVAVLGTLAFEGKRHIFVSLFIAVLSLLFFFAGFEKKELGTRRTVIISIMIALSVVGRFIPFFKPVTALTVIAAVYLGGEAGFAVGSLSALISNFYFGQGPWTPFQMLAWGLIGLFAGFLHSPLKKSKTLIVTYGVLSGLIFSAFMDVWTVLWYSDGFELGLYLTALVSALPHTAMYAASNFLFLFFLSKPFGDKLERIKIKYGI